MATPKVKSREGGIYHAVSRAFIPPCSQAVKLLLADNSWTRHFKQTEIGTLVIFLKL